jgi:cytoskeletal protein CcmA (bactofilin family)
MPGKPEPAEPPAPARRFTDSLDAHSTIIGPDTRIEGDLSSDEPVDVAGTLDGDLHVSGHCRVRQGARVTGRLEAKSLVVEGEVNGPGLVADKIEIGATGRVRSRIQARVVAIADGAFFEGEVRMDDSGAPLTFREKRRGAESAT